MFQFQKFLKCICRSLIFKIMNLKYLILVLKYREVQLVITKRPEPIASRGWLESSSGICWIRVYVQRYDLLFLRFQQSWTGSKEPIVTISNRVTTQIVIWNRIYGHHFYSLLASARSHPTNHYGPYTVSENSQRNKYS